MWTQSIIKVEKNIISFSVTVEFFKDGIYHSNYTLENVSDLESIKSLVQNRLDILKKIDATNVLIGPVDLTPASPAQKDLDRQHYFDLLGKWNRVQEDLKNGLIKADDPAVVQLASDLKAAYKPEYSGL